MVIIFVNTRDYDINVYNAKGLGYVFIIYEKPFVSNVPPHVPVKTVNSSMSATLAINLTASPATVFSIQTRRFHDAIASKNTMLPMRFRPSLARTSHSFSIKPWKAVVPNAVQTSAWTLERTVS